MPFLEVGVGVVWGKSGLNEEMCVEIVGRMMMRRRRRRIKSAKGLRSYIETQLVNLTIARWVGFRKRTHVVWQNTQIPLLSAVQVHEKVTELHY